MTFLFDFGAEWIFTLVLDRIDPLDPELEEVQVLEARGTPPRQYGDGWDGE